MLQMTIQSFKWAVIGAGPAGIAAVGKLIDSSVKPKDILWLDPYFNVGDLGRLWPNVSSNTVVSKFTDFLYASPAFNYEANARQFTIHTLPSHQTCLLKEIVEPLQWITNELRTKVRSKETTVQHLNMTNKKWVLSQDSQHYTANQVILATGSVPSTLTYPDVTSLPFDIAIDKQRLAQVINLNETYGVFGSSHSAFIIIRNLVELGAKKVINFYRSPCRYAIDMGDWTLFDNTGLKGDTATWVRDHIDGTLPKNLIRVNLLEQDIHQPLALCDQVIYAVGFERRNSITIENFKHMSYDTHTGIIAPGLFGLGIAYPELKADPFGIVESQVGLWKFMRYLNEVMPVWLKYRLS
ncbi:pyridine nucleotide-disulphide oxidoreductase [Legionella beliardensis]|uniref:Pyridine nucleotide-disulphide oxidoreductase n=2 Tax=Legionella beliardensis TaxID=91822 RepID=A0A378I0A8_9GAMM|nr:pyridine nucleotide-disulphide oxidoreductase [Legionella beliardensis]